MFFLKSVTEDYNLLVKSLLDQLSNLSAHVYSNDKRIVESICRNMTINDDFSDIVDGLLGDNSNMYTGITIMVNKYTYLSSKVESEQNHLYNTLMLAAVEHYHARDVKMTNPLMDGFIESDQEYIKITNVVNDYQFFIRFLRDIKDVLIHRKDILIQMSINKRQN